VPVGATAGRDHHQSYAGEAGEGSRLDDRAIREQDERTRRVFPFLDERRRVDLRARLERSFTRR
jgi:hypothetical protein